MEFTQALAEAAVTLGAGPLAPAVTAKAKQCLLDVIGIAVRARTDADSSAPLAAAVAALGATGPCTVPGHSEQYAPHYAALLGGAYAHSFDFDDTYAPGSVHVGAAVVPAALAVAEAAGVSGSALLAAITAGYEVACRVAVALNPRSHYDRGFHPSATAGTFGAAAAAACIGGFSAAQMANTFGIALSQAAGTLQFFDNGSWNKRLQVGLAAHNGVLVAHFTRHGILGAARALEGQWGLLKAYTDAPQVDLALQDLGRRPLILETAFKPYPSCRFTHAALDGIRDIMALEKLQHDEIESIRIGLSHQALELVARPEARKRNPQNVVDAQFSMPWLAATMAVRGNVGWTDFADLHDPTIRQMMDRVTVEVDPEVEAVYGGNYPGSVTLVARGRRYSSFVLHPKGEPAAPLTWDELCAKFHGLVIGLLPAGRAAAIIEQVDALERLADVRQLTALLRHCAEGGRTP